MPQDKAPSPDGFTGHFFKKCWQTIRSDVMAAINSFYNNRSRDLKSPKQSEHHPYSKEGQR
jgi:hypothetical protein